LGAGRSLAKSDEKLNEIPKELTECFGGFLKSHIFELKAAFFKRMLANKLKKIFENRLKNALQ